MTHWLWIAIRTYLLHPNVGRGYAFWSGPGSDLAYAGVAIGVLRHINCEQPGCWRRGHRHPDHGRPVCRKHWHSPDVVPPKENPE